MSTTYLIWDTKEKTYFKEGNSDLRLIYKSDALSFRDEYLAKGNYPDEPISVIEIHEFSGSEFIKII